MTDLTPDAMAALTAAAQHEPTHDDPEAVAATIEVAA